MIMMQKRIYDAEAESETYYVETYYVETYYVDVEEEKDVRSRQSKRLLM